MVSFKIVRNLNGKSYILRTDDWHIAAKLNRTDYALKWAARKWAIGDTHAFEPYRPVWFESEIEQFAAFQAAAEMRVA